MIVNGLKKRKETALCYSVLKNVAWIQNWIHDMGF